MTEKESGLDEQARLAIVAELRLGDAGARTKDEAQPEPAPPETIPFRKIIVGITDAGLMTVLHSEVTIIEQSDIGKRLTQNAEQTIRQQCDAYAKRGKPATEAADEG